MKKLLKLVKMASKYNPIIRQYVLFDGSHARATDLELHYKVAIGGHFPAPCLVPVELLKSALTLSKIPQWAGDTLNGIKLSGHAGETDPAEYPAWPAVVDALPVQFYVKDVPGTISKLTRAAALGDVRYYLNGLCFTADGALATTNGHQLHLQKRAFVPLATGEHVVIRALFDLFPDLDNLSLSKHHARATLPGGEVISKLIDGKFPDYKRVVPEAKARPVHIEVNPEQLDNVRKVAAFVKVKGEKFNALKINKDGTMQNSTGELVLPFCQPLPAELGVNIAYLITSLEAAGVPCTVNLGDKANSKGDLDDSLLILGQDPDFSAVVMPMRI